MDLVWGISSCGWTLLAGLTTTVLSGCYVVVGNCVCWVCDLPVAVGVSWFIRDDGDVSADRASQRIAWLVDLQHRSGGDLLQGKNQEVQVANGVLYAVSRKDVHGREAHLSVVSFRIVPTAVVFDDVAIFDFNDIGE